ncbi:transmembrane protein 41A-A-like [Dendronephthya gigantea]|uniref:transmembrane protein 41A-A-like n=1 Tax=Dendronephthya gigantea TaxID=151771 RepID=UPI00106A42E8|nr:transmembrane protein 41A-A-like [Dendronephthya gigantea]
MFFFKCSELQFPQNLDELKNLAKLLRDYQQQKPFYVLLLFCSAYLYKQTFAIPGSVFMNLLAGALYGLKYGLPCVCIMTATGASCCFLLSKYFGRPVLLHYFPQKLQRLQNKIKENSDNLFGFLLFLRFFPMSPNWFLNMASPVLDIPLKLFFPSVFIGLLPYNYICVQTGCLLSELSSLDELLTMNAVVKLIGIATVSLVPGMIIKRMNNNRTHNKKEK